MTKKLALVLTLFSTSILFGQNKLKTEPFIIKGQLIDCTEKYVCIFFEDKDGQPLIDTIHLDTNGNFYLKTFKVKKPQRANIQQNNIRINNLFVAPGYNLTITGNGKDFLSLLKTKKITGIGSESNNYYFILDSILNVRVDTTRWFQLKETNLLTYIKKERKLKDSVASLVFNTSAVQDKYLTYFGKMVLLDNKLMELYMLLTHINMNRYNYEKSVAIVKNNIDNSVLNNLRRDEYLNSYDYKNGFISIAYLNYLVNLDYLRDSTLRNKKEYKLDKANKVYRGKVKEFVIYKFILSYFDFCPSLEKLNEYKEQFEPYISVLANQFYKKSISTKLSNKESELLKTLIGKPAPKFTLESNLGHIYNLEDFKGKVIYLDLWASWCGPCRKETPSFKILYDKYRNLSQIAFISIAVSDGINEWKKALKEDKPDWIQLLDKEGAVLKSYVANSIPKFILIDKQGNIVNMDAPRPSSGEEIEKLLNQEIAK